MELLVDVIGLSLPNVQKCPAVLVVEDDLFDRELFAIAFRAVCPDAPLHCVGNGTQAIAYLAGEGMYGDRRRYPYPNVIITDLKMPEVDGFAVLDYLRRHPKFAVIPTVMFSSSADPDDVTTAYRLGASSYIVKPSTAAEIQKLIKTLVEYWTCCEAPPITSSGEHQGTEHRGKLGEQYGAD